MSTTEYKQIFDGGVFAISQDRALTVEIQQSPRGGYQLKIWELYKTSEGEWAYCNPKGGRGIVLPLNTPDLSKFLMDNLNKVHVVATKVCKTGETTTTKTESKVVTKQVNPKPQETINIGGLEIPLTAEFAAMVQQFNTTQAPKSKKGGNKKA